jgi:hypothetical protein
MNIIIIEDKRNKLLNDLEVSSLPAHKLILLNNFIRTLVDTNNKNIISAFIPEFINQYIYLLLHYNSFCKPPETTLSIIKITEFLIASEYLTTLQKSEAEVNLLNIRNNFTLLLDIVNGEYVSKNDKLYFPVISETGDGSSLLNSLSVKLEASREETKFIIIPSDTTTEKRLINQVNISWELAIAHLHNYKIKPKYYKVYISFDYQEAYLSGDSLGANLFLSFLSELLKYHHSPIVVNVKNQVALTGGLLQNSKLIPVSRNIISQKTEVVFYSPCRYFLVPKEDLSAAEEKLSRLKEYHPARNLDIISVSDIEDIIARRNIVDIRRDKLHKEVISYVKRNKISMMLSLLLIILGTVYSSVVWDQNPDNYIIKGNILHIRNSLGQTLWTKVISLNSDIPSNLKYLGKACRIIDINNDGINEVIVSMESTENNDNLKGVTTCYSADQNVIWSYKFIDRVSTPSIEHTENYISYLIDTLTINNTKTLLVAGRNIPFYPVAFFKLDLLTGERIDSANTAWHAGGISYAFVGDFDRNGNPEIVVAGGNNGFERAVVFSVDIDKLKGQLPSKPYYTFKNIEQADYNFYILLPQTDYSYYHKNRYNFPGWMNYNSTSNEFEISVTECPISNHDGNIYYTFNSAMEVKLIDCCDAFSFNRDDLIRRGELTGPFTNTAEYFNLLKTQIIYLNKTD